MTTQALLTTALRDYQERDVDALRHCFRRGRRAPLYALPTGGGKTVCFSYIAKSAVAGGRRVLILVHRAELLRQASRTLDRWGVAHGVIAPRYASTSQMVQVGSVQTVVRRLATMTPPDLIIIDEAHHAVAGTWQKIIEAFPAARLLGVTATPARLDGRGLGRHCGGYFDELVVGPAIHELIRDGHLVRPRVFVAEQRLNLEGVRNVAGDYNSADLAERVSSTAIVGDAVDHYRRICRGVPAIAFCVNLAHADIVTRAFVAGGFRARRIDGTMNDDDRQDIVAALGDGRLDVMVSVDLVSEGFDVPVCGAALLLRPTQSEGLYLQQCGRSLRPAPGKTCAFILDHAGNCAAHGLPQDEREWSLDGRVRRVRAASPVMCPSCFAMLPAGTTQCPECECSIGDARRERQSREIDEREGELIELTPELIEQHRAARRNEVNAAQTREALLAIARARGYNPRWVEHVLAARTARRRA